MRRKLLFMDNKIKTGGGNYVLLDIAKALKNLGHEVCILIPSTGPILSKFLDEGLDVMINKEIFINPENHLIFFKKFDLVFLNAFDIFSLTEPIKKSDVPIIWIIHVNRIKALEKFGITKFHFNLPKKIICVSNAVRKTFSHLGESQKFLTIQNGINIRKIEEFIQHNYKIQLRKKWNFSNNDKIITIIGRFTQIKGQHVLIEAANKILAKKKSNIHFLLVGFGQKRYLEKIQNQIIKYNLQSNIHIIISPQKIYEMFLISDIFVSCSFTEAFGRAITEAMTFNLPIIGTNVGGIPELIEDGFNGILIPPGESLLLAQKIEWLLDNPKVCENYVSRSKRKVCDELDIKNVIISYDNLIEEICSKK